MSEAEHDHTAVVHTSSKFSVIWIVPIVATLIGAWMIYFTWTNQGPLIEIRFETANGIEAGKTKLKLKNVELGMVEEVRLTENSTGVTITARMEPDAKPLLKEDTSFWVVRPRIGVEGISGLNTLVSGAYIEFAAGTETSKKTTRFVGLEAPPVTPVGTAGLHITLDSSGNRALQVGDKITFHGLVVGRIEYVHFNESERITYYNAFIEAPFHTLISSNTRFWFNSALRLEFSGEGVSLEIGSLQTLLGGGLSFDVPENLPPGELIEKRAFFTIYANRSAIRDKHYRHSLPYIVLVNDSVRGLKPGAPVEYKGIKIGSVTRTDIDYPELANLLDEQTQIPVMIEVQPARMGYADNEAAATAADARVRELIKQGLAANLVTGSYLTGNKYIDLRLSEIVPAHIDTFDVYAVIPTVGNQLGNILAQVETTLATVNDMPLDEVAINVNRLLVAGTAALNEVKNSAAELDSLLADPESHALIATLNAFLASFEKLAADFSGGAPGYEELVRTLRVLQASLSKLGPVLEQVRRQPNSLIFGGDTKEDLQPKAANSQGDDR